MKKEVKRKLLFWTPRGLIILFMAFLSMFSLDVFGEYGFPEVLVALFMHMIPTIVLAAVLVGTWNRPKWAAMIFFGLGAAFTVFFDLYEDIIGFLIIGLPVFVVAGLFAWEHHRYGKKR